MKKNLQDIKNKILSNTRISDDDCLILYRSNDLIGLGEIANIVRERKNGNATYYNINRHINYSNVCYVECKFCEFGQPKSSTKSYLLSLDEMKKIAAEAAGVGATELHMVGGLHPDYKIDYYENLLREIKRVVPNLHLKAFTAVEIDYFAKVSKLSVEETLRRLMAAGLDSIPGGGAEIFAEKTRKEICPNKIEGRRWLEIHRRAHKLGIRSNATMLYGHIESDEDRVDHLRKLRELQDETGGFQTFIPLSFIPFDTPMAHIPEPTGLMDLKQIAVSRIYLDNFDHIKTYWIMSGLKMAQLALSFGADDLDGTVTQERIVHMAGAKTPEALSVETIRKLIREAGRDPVERDTLYKVIQKVA
ncbi:MAG: aminofutalosine synthase MqnE [Deltaproteobacteria bacterium]|nr:aminofutalosine synthase MqnE [Deltaproteobacteria bacterium]